MGYQVGNQCYETKQQAEDVYYSQVLPSIAADGTLYQIQRNQSGWQYQGKNITASLPTCDPVQNFKDGVELGFLLLTIAVSVWFVNYCKKLIGF